MKEEKKLLSKWLRNWGQTCLKDFCVLGEHAWCKWISSEREKYFCDRLGGLVPGVCLIVVRYKS